MFKVNPYRADAGLMPTFLAGREDSLKEAENMFEALKLNIPVQSVIYYGLRGVGKTVLMNKIYSIATDKGLFCKQIEVEIRKDFISQVASSCQVYLRTFSGKEKFKALVNKAIDAIKSLVVSFDPENKTFSLSAQERDFYVTSSLSVSLTDVFDCVGRVAIESGVPICFFIDEMQYMKKDELSALLTAVHRSNQLGYPIMIVGAGLPKIIKTLSDTKSYAERLFAYRPIGALDDAQAKKAIIEPLKAFNIEYSDEAINKIISITKGYPFFIQQLCYIVYDQTDKYPIGIENIEKNIDNFLDALDNGFFKSRYERCSDMEKIFIFAMVKCGELPCTIANVSKNISKKGKSISPTRAKLIDKGIIYATRYGELDFTVSEFDGFIKRLGEYHQWIQNNQTSNILLNATN